MVAPPARKATIPRPTLRLKCLRKKPTGPTGAAGADTIISEYLSRDHTSHCCVRHITLLLDISTLSDTRLPHQAQVAHTSRNF